MYKPSDLPRRQRRIAVALTVLGVTAVALVGGALFHEAAALSVNVSVEERGDPTSIHRATTLAVDVENTGTQAIDPRFSAAHLELQTRFFWARIDGPRRLAPGERGRYLVEAPIVEAGLSPGGTALMTVTDAESGRLYREMIHVPDADPPSILNPGLEHQRMDHDVGYDLPYRWGPGTSDRGPERLDITGSGSSISTTVTNVTREEGPWAMAGIQQTIGFPDRLHVTATPESVVEEPTRTPPVATGVEFGESDHRIWIVFANVSERQVLYRPGELSYVFVFVPATPGERVAATVDVAAIYDRQGWEQPPRATRTIDGIEYRQRTARLLAFAAVYPGNAHESAAVTFDAVGVPEDLHGMNEATEP